MNNVEQEGIDYVIRELQDRLKEIQEKQPHAFLTIAAYEDVIYDLSGGMMVNKRQRGYST